MGVFLSPDVAARAGRHFDDPVFARFWETVQDLEMPIAFHVVVRDRQWFRPWQRYDPSDGLFGFAFLAIDVMAAFTQMLASGMFERYPRLQCAVLEAGSNWIASWLDRLDHKHRVMAHRRTQALSNRDDLAARLLEVAQRGEDLLGRLAHPQNQVRLGDQPCRAGFRQHLQRAW